MILLDLFLLAMIILCVVYCWVLNRRIQDLQNSRIEFARMIKELNASIVKAEHNVSEMSELSKVTSAEIRKVVDEARNSSTELVAICEVANDLSLELNKQLKAAKTQESPAENDTNYGMRSAPGERFNEEDLAPLEEKSESQYTNHLKNFIQNIVSKKTDGEYESANLNQMSYYDTLRKIKVKK
jgi:hypothetical protein